MATDDLSLFTDEDGEKKAALGAPRRWHLAMRTIISAKNRLQRLHADVPPLPIELLRKSIRAAAKWHFDLLKNVLVVGGLGYAAGQRQLPYVEWSCLGVGNRIIH
jgi:hypothetical protein